MKTLVGLAIFLALTARAIDYSTCQQEDRDDFWASRPIGEVKSPWANRDASPAEAKAGRKFCERITSPELRARCTEGLQEVKLSLPALDHCGTLGNEPERVECALDVRDVYYDAKAVELCRSLNFEADRKDCLDKMKGRVVDAGASAFCRKKASLTEARDCLIKRSIAIGERLPRHNCPTRYYETATK